MLKQLTKEQFDEFPRERKRVILAQDVILQLNAKKFVEENGTYFDFSQGGRLMKWHIQDDSAKDIINASVCHVCAKGALICSYVGQFNNAKVYELNSEYEEVKEIFGYTLWNVMESAFEAWGSFFKSTPLRKLMQSLIDNEGKFIMIEGRKYE